VRCQRAAKSWQRAVAESSEPAFEKRLVPEMSEKHIRFEFSMRQQLLRWTAATSWLRGSSSAETRSSAASHVIRVKYPL